jgi:hypothetical protein
MGFKAKKKLYLLRFAADHDLAGLEVTMSSVSMGALLSLQEMSTRQDEIVRDKTQFREMIEVFAGAMIGWNLEDDFDRPIPITVDGVLTQDTDFIMSIIVEWTKAISGVSRPLGDGSTSGGQSPEASLPMEPRSPSPPS